MIIEIYRHPFEDLNEVDKETSRRAGDMIEQETGKPAWVQDKRLPIQEGLSI